MTDAGDGEADDFFSRRRLSDMNVDARMKNGIASSV